MEFKLNYYLYYWIKLKCKVTYSVTYFWKYLLTYWYLMPQTIAGSACHPDFTEDINLWCLLFFWVVRLKLPVAVLILRFGDIGASSPQSVGTVIPTINGRHQYGVFFFFGYKIKTANGRFNLAFRRYLKKFIPKYRDCHPDNKWKTSRRCLLFFWV